MSHSLLKKYLTGLWLLLLVGITLALFWYNEYKYTLPTPVPAHYQAVKNGVSVSLGAGFAKYGDKPFLLHFFNPACPCSRFNIAHVKTLAALYGDKVQFVIVVIGNRPFSAKDISKKFGLDLPVIPDGGLSVRCGVYSTPQAAILTSEKNLFYRGNYNRSRYCTDSKTAYARQALDDLLNHRINSTNSIFAIKSYGCQLDD